MTNIKIEESEHECLLLEYRNNDRLYLPVENLEMLSKYNSHDENITLDAGSSISLPITFEAGMNELELSDNLTLVSVIKTKQITSRTRGTSTTSEVAVYSVR